MRKFHVITSLLLSAALLFSSGCQKKKSPVEDVTLRFGVLPVMQALPLFIAEERGYFDAAGIKVELIPFNTAADKDIAMVAGSIDGQFADLFTPIVLEGNGVDISIVATNYDTQDNRRMFAVLVKPGLDISNPGELKNVPIAASSNTVIHFVIEKLLTAGGVSLDQIKLVESKNIGIRFQMLITGQVDAAALPEPLVSAAIGQGAVMIADDSGISASQTVLVFKQDFAETYPKAVKSFLAAANKAAAFISQNPDSVRDAMVKYARLPEAMKDKFHPPLFPTLHAPDQASIAEAVQWLKRQEVLKKTLHYENLVNDAYLP